MPKKSKKSKSKRLTLKQKYKVLKKVKEHHRKKRKDAKKNPKSQKKAKDPGIPNAWPFKEELIEQLKASRERQAAREKARQQQLWAEKNALAAGGLEAIQQGADQRLSTFNRLETTNDANAAGSFVDYSLKAFYKDFAKVVEASDVIIEVLDARDPSGSRCQDVEKFVRRMGPTKKIILLLNKIDLVPREVVEEWLKYFREELPSVAFKCSTQQQSGNLGRKALPQATSADAAIKGSECLGADTLLQLLKNYARTKGGLKSSITVGVVGLPNVGKSSLINSLKRTRVAQVGNAPGVTRSIQEVHLDKQVTLLDSPGVVFAQAGSDGAAAAALRNAVKIEQLEDPVLPIVEIVRRCPAKQLMSLYKIPKFADVDEFLTHVATARGKLRRGGVVDTAAAARTVLQDWNDGRIPYFTRPPKRETEVAGTAAVVTDWGADFDAEAVFAAEETAVIAGLPSIKEGKAFFETETAGAVHMADEEAAQAGRIEDDMEDDEETDEESDSDGDEMDDGEPSAPVTRSRSGKGAQNEQLYVEKGQYNPHAARAEKKRKKRQSGGRDAVVDEDGDSDYDFDADWGPVEDDNAFAGLGEEGDSEEDVDEMHE